MGRKFEIYDTNAEYGFEEAKHDYADNRGVSEGAVTDNEVYEFIRSESELNFECEQMNLDVALEGKILAIADMGLWNGRTWGYSLLGSNLSNIMTSGNGDSFSIFSDGKDIRKISQHHDGTNYIIYREVREGVNISGLTVRIYNNETIDRKTLNRYTKSLLPAVVKIYE